MSKKIECRVVLDEKTHAFYSLMAKHTLRSVNQVLSNTLHDIPKLVWKCGREGLTIDQVLSSEEECE